MSLFAAMKRRMYRGNRPLVMAAAANRVFAVTASTGHLGRVVTLEVRGRRTGRLRSFPVVVADYDGERYLVAMLGENANWIRNVRAAGGHVVLRHGRCESVCLEEVDSSTTAPILQRYLQVAPGARPHIPVDPEAPLEEFEKIAAQFPVFRVCAD